MRNTKQTSQKGHGSGRDYKIFLHKGPYLTHDRFIGLICMYLRREQSNEHQTPNKYLAFPNLHQLKFKPGQSNHVG